MSDNISEKVLLGKMRILNACNNINFQWEYRRAQKSHTDQFDKEICEGEHYFRLCMGGARSKDLKLSYHSMESFLLLVFAPHPDWEKQAIKSLNDRMEQTRNLIDKLRQ